MLISSFFKQPQKHWKRRVRKSVVVVESKVYVEFLNAFVLLFTFYENQFCYRVKAERIKTMFSTYAPSEKLFKFHLRILIILATTI